MIVGFIAIFVILLIIDVLMFAYLYKWVKTTVEDFIGEKEYEYQMLIHDIDREKTEMKAYLESLGFTYKSYLDKLDLIIERIVDVGWKEFDDNAKKIILMYLKGYNISEIVAKVGVPEEMVMFTLMVALGREVDKNA